MGPRSNSALVAALALACSGGLCAQAPPGGRLEISGQVMLDAIYDFKRVDPDWNATLRPSTIPVRCPGDAGCGKDGETLMSIRQSKIAFKGFIPTPKGELTTLLDFDLFDTGGGNTHARVLNAWAELGAFGAGQTDSVFMDMEVFPNVVDYWGPNGMVYLRNPQLRYTPVRSDALKIAISLEAPNSAIDTGKVALIAPELGAAVTGHSRYPDLAGSVRVEREWGHFQAAGILRSVGFETRGTPNSEPAGDETGYGLNLSGHWKAGAENRIVAQIVYGRGIASYMNDGGADLAPGAGLRAEAVKSVGWLLYYDHSWNEEWTSSAGYSEHRQTNTAGQLASAFKSGRYASVNLLFSPVKSVTVGAEALWGQLEHKDGSTGDDTRLQFSARYTF